jgi:retron-type reverse transcriptase
VDIDLAKFFDTLNHDLLIQMLREQAYDTGLIRLIRKFLKSGVTIDGLRSPTEEGAPRGSLLKSAVKRHLSDQVRRTA